MARTVTPHPLATAARSPQVGNARARNTPTRRLEPNSGVTDAPLGLPSAPIPASFVPPVRAFVWPRPDDEGDA